MNDWSSMMHHHYSRKCVCLRRTAAKTAANRLIFRGSIIRPNPRLSLSPTVSFVMYWAIDQLTGWYTTDNKHIEKKRVKVKESLKN